MFVKTETGKESIDTHWSCGSYFQYSLLDKLDFTFSNHNKGSVFIPVFSPFPLNPKALRHCVLIPVLFPLSPSPGPP